MRPTSSSTAAAFFLGAIPLPNTHESNSKTHRLQANGKEFDRETCQNAPAKCGVSAATDLVQFSTVQPQSPSDNRFAAIIFALGLSHGRFDSGTANSDCRDGRHNQRSVPE